MKDCCEQKSCSRPVSAVTKKITIVGNPNCGKTTLFNSLTGARQRIGNWSGVTVERKSGYYQYYNSTVEVIDLPGVYSLTIMSESGAIDERIACEFILRREADVVINILDATNLERHLYLTTQLLEMGVPMIVAVNMMDVARTRGIHLDLCKLSELLGCPVLPLEASKGKGVEELKRVVDRKQTEPRPLGSGAHNINLTTPLDSSITTLATAIQPHLPENFRDHASWFALRLLEEDIFVRRFFTPEALQEILPLRNQLAATLNEDADILLADARYQFVHDLVQQCVRQSATKKITRTERLDQILLHRLFGLPIFLAVMYAMFLFAINIGGAFQDFFDIGGNAIFVNGLTAAFNALHAPAWLTALLANGVGKGITTTLTFIPVIGAMFLFLAFLEDSGYMARAAFVVDRLMRALGLPGKAFVPMIVGFGCNVPGVMAARTLENKRDRILTIMMSPFMSCGARLAIFAVFTAAFFPHNGQNIVFALYLIGIAMAMLTGFVLRTTLLRGEPSPLTMELPPYHVPRLKTLCLHAWQRLKSFVIRAGRLIVPICVLIGALNALNIDGTLNTGEGDANSVLSHIGRLATPIFKPMGMHADNWPATVGLVTGILAKEVVVGTLNTLYSQMGHLASAASNESFSILAGLHDALRSIPENFAQLGSALSNPVLAKAPIHTVDKGVYGMMYQQFDGKIGAFAYLLFILLYFPCVSTTAAMLRELHRGWSVFSVLWMTGIAYGTAVVFYQAATLLQHPMSSSLWVCAVSGIFLSTLFGMRWFAKRDQRLTSTFVPVREPS